MAASITDNWNSSGRAPLAERHANVNWQSASTNLAPLLTALSVVLLLFSSLDDGALGIVMKLAWVSCFAALARMDLGSALGTYIFAAAIYATHHFEGAGFLLQRPDNLAAAILAGVCLWRALPRFDRWKHDGLLLSVAVFLLYAMVDSAAAGALGGDNLGIRTYVLPFCIFVLLMNSAMTLREFRAFLWTLALLGGYSGLVCILERLDMSQWVLPPWVSDRQLNSSFDTGRSGGILIQAEWTGLMLGLICILLVFLLRAESLAGRAFRALAILLCAFGVFLTFTRAAWMGLLLACGLWLWHRWEVHPAAGQQAWLKRVLAAAVIGSLLVVFAVMPALFHERIENPDTMYFRLNLWAAGLRMIAQKPLFGMGFGQYAEHVTEFYEETGSIPYKAVTTDPSYPAHNTFISVAVELGLLGLLFYLIVGVRLYRRARDGSAACFGTAGALAVLALTLAYIVNVTFVTAHELSTNALFFGAMGALASSADRRAALGKTRPKLVRLTTVNERKG